MEPLIRKSWYSLPEAADYLTHNTEGKTGVSVSDLLQLSTEGQLNLTIHLFTMTPAEIGDMVVWADWDAMASELAGPAGATVKTSDQGHPQQYRGDVVDDGPPVVVFESSGSEVFQGEQLSVARVGVGSELLRLWWRLSLEENPPAPAQLVAAAKAADPALSESQIYFERSANESSPFACIPLSWLSDDTLIGIARDQLDALLSETGSGPAGGKTASDPGQLPEDVDLLLAAWRRFWRNASQRDRTTWPLRDDVKQWLQDQGMSGKNADAGATMISPDYARKGGRR